MYLINNLWKVREQQRQIPNVNELDCTRKLFPFPLLIFWLLGTVSIAASYKFISIDKTTKLTNDEVDRPRYISSAITIEQLLFSEQSMSDERKRKNKVKEIAAFLKSNKLNINSFAGFSEQTTLRE